MCIVSNDGIFTHNFSSTAAVVDTLVYIFVALSMIQFVRSNSYFQFREVHEGEKGVRIDSSAAARQF